MRRAPLGVPERLPLRDGDKFGIYTFKNFWPQPAFLDLEEIGGACWVYPGPVLFPDSFIVGELGKHFEQVFTNGNFSLIARAHARQPGSVDGQSRELFEHLERIRRGLLIQGRVRFDDCAYLGGGWRSGKPDFRGDTRAVPEFPAFGSKLRTVGKRAMHRAILVAENLRRLSAAGGRTRMGMGFYVLTMALREKQFDERLHLMVRSLEGLVFLEGRIGAEAFAERASFFAGSSSESTLTEVYKMRGKIEHLRSWALALEKSHDASVHSAVAERRLRQAEFLACESYSRVLVSPRLCAHFSTDDSQRDFWNMPEATRRRLWGPVTQIDRVK